MTNNTSESFSFIALGISKHVNGRRHHLRPLYRHLERIPFSVDPGETKRWTVRIDNQDASIAETDSVTSLTGLGPGRYVLGVGGVDEDGETVGFDMYQPTTEIELTGSQPELAPFGVEARRSGNEVVVNFSEEGESILVERSEGEGPTIIAEQVMQSLPLRNTLSQFEEGVEKVRYTSPNAQRLLRYAREGYGFDEMIEFKGEEYRITQT